MAGFADAEPGARDAPVTGPRPRQRRRARGWTRWCRATGRNAPGAHAVRLVKGSHIVVPQLYDGAPVLHPAERGRPGGVHHPLRGRPHAGGHHRRAVRGRSRARRHQPEETTYLCGVVGDYFTRRSPRRTWCGATPACGPWPTAARRTPPPSPATTCFDLEGGAGSALGAPLLSVFGGKITTFRKLAEHALKDLGAALGDARPAWTARAPPAGRRPAGARAFDGFCGTVRARWPWLGEPHLTRMCHAYGTRVERVLDGAGAWTDMGRDFGGGLTERGGGIPAARGMGAGRTT